MLEHHGAIDAGAADRHSIHFDAAGRQGLQPADTAQQRGFATAGRADEGHEFIAAHGQVHILQGNDVAFAIAECLACRFNADL